MSGIILPRFGKPAVIRAVMATDPRSNKGDAAVLSDAVVEGMFVALLERLRAGLKEKGMTISELARRAGLSRSAVSLLLSGKRNATWCTVLRVSVGLETTMDWLSREAWCQYAGVGAVGPGA